MLTFYLRGSRNPRGTALPGSEDWPPGEPARWSDGRAITASDFVYSWRRVIDPRTGALLANYLFDVKNAEAIYTGKSASVKDLGIEAADEFTLKVELRSPVPFFLKLTAAGVLVAVPRQAIEAAKQRGVESSWTEPGRIVVSGPFYLQERRPHDRIVFRRNPAYYNAGSVRLEELCFLQVTDGVTNVNLFKAGEADSMSDTVLPSQFLPALEGAKELHVRPALDSYFYSINVERPPFHNPLLRYALNMAMDKKAVASIVGAGRAAAATFVPPLPGYRPPERLKIPLQGRTCDVLAYDPATARELLAAAGFPQGRRPDGRRLRINLGYGIRAMGTERSEIVRQSWQRNLGIDVSLAGVEMTVLPQILGSRAYEGLMEVDWNADYADPNAFLSVFTSASTTNPSAWRDRDYDDALAAANAEAEAAVRMRKLADCEMHLLQSMPLLPLYFDKWTYLRKPFVHGLYLDPLDGITFHDAWIDTNWRPQ